MKALVGAFNQEKALVGAFSVIVQPVVEPMDRFTALVLYNLKSRPKSGSMLLYSRKKVRYRRDGYCWKKRKDGKTTREDHMKLKVQGMEVIKQLIYFTLNCNCCIGKLH